MLFTRNALVTGGSFTYGYGVEDEESYPFLLQEKLSDYRVINAATPGHGTVQSILQMEDMIADGRTPAVLVIHYISFHDERNALSPAFAQLLRDVFLPDVGAEGAFQEPSRATARRARFPRLVRVGQRWRVELISAHELHTNFPGRESLAAVNTLQTAYQGWAAHPAADTGATERSLDILDRLCRRHGVRMMLARLDDTSRSRKVARYAKRLGLITVDLSVDYSDERYTHMPHDWHPSALTHGIYANRMAEALEAVALETR